MTDTPTSVTFLLDRTGSMASIAEATIEAFNAYLATTKADPLPVEFTFLTFDSISLDKVAVRAKPSEVAPLVNGVNFVPRGSTPLIDAAYKTIEAIGPTVTDGQKVVVCIQTDGEENASTEHTWGELNALIKAKSALGWQFVFMGAGIDAYKQGQRMGISQGSTVSYSTDKVSTRAAFAAAASNRMSYSSGATPDMTFSAAQKTAAGDRFDLGKSLPTGVVAPVKPAPRARTKIVDDVRL